MGFRVLGFRVWGLGLRVRVQGLSADIIHKDMGSPNRAARLKQSSVEALSKCSCPDFQVYFTAMLPLLFQFKTSGYC